MNILQAAFLGLLQGLSEFLPISSSGHLVLGAALLGLPAPGLTFSIMVHLGTALATVVMLWPEISWLLTGVFAPREPSHRKTAFTVVLCIVLASVPAFLVGVAWGDFVDRIFEAPIVVPFGLLATSLVLFLGRPENSRATGARAARRHSRSSTDDRSHSGSRSPSSAVSNDTFRIDAASRSGRGREDMRGRNREARAGYDRDVLRTVTYRRAGIVGLAQATAIMPGLSRSGMTLTAGLLSGMSREDSARFSFLLALPAVVGGAFLDFLDISAAGAQIMTSQTLVAAAVAFVSGMFALSSVVQAVRKGDLTKYAWYCLAVGAASLVWFLIWG